MLKMNKPNKTQKTNVGEDVFVNSNTKKCNTGVGADASVCPNVIKECQKIGRGTRHRAQEPAAITLVALIITVIILIILAGVSLNLALGENGIFVKSKEAVDKYKDSAQREQNEMDNLYNTLKSVGKKGNDDVTQGDDPTTGGTLDLNTLTIGTAINAENYGKMTNYASDVDNGDESSTETGGWRLFYQDENCTYLISDKLIYKKGTTGFKPSDYYKTIKKDENSNELKYQSGADVSTVGQRLSPMLTGTDETHKTNFFTGSIKNTNILATAWLTDPENELWKKYKNEDAEFAIGSPTVELYAASFDAAADAAKKNDPPEERTKIGTGLDVGRYGYTEETSSGDLQQSYNHGIYNKYGSSFWWLASPNRNSDRSVLHVGGNNSYFSNSTVDGSSNAVRPIVCIQTTVFNNSGRYQLIDDKVVEQ